MRIVGGRMRGTRLAPVGTGDAAAHLRPTSDRVREAVFNLLLNGGYGDPVAGAHVLDLFAGTGAMGLEALSRGAASATLVDSGAAAARLIAANIARCRAEGTARLVRTDATGLGRLDGAPFDLVLLDPPYGGELGARALANALRGGLVGRDALIVWEDARPPILPQGVVPLDQRRYGGTVITIAQRDADEPA